MIIYFVHNLIWTEGLFILMSIAFVGWIGWWWFRVLFYASILFFAFSLYFFRNPLRVCLAAQNDTNILICPADGKVVSIENGDYGDALTQKIAIFLSPLDVHVQWAPMSGSIEKISYKPGAFTMAFLPKSSELNERNDIVIVDKERRIKVRQIAGTIARRICCWVLPTQSIQRGDKYGMIRFGSRVEIFVPSSVVVALKVGERVYGGQSVIGKW